MKNSIDVQSQDHVKNSRITTKHDPTRPEDQEKTQARPRPEQKKRFEV